jgi:hypothetical protein
VRAGRFALRATRIGVHDAPMPTAHLPLRTTELLAAGLAAVLGWVGVLLAVLGPSQAAVSATIDPSGSSSAAVGASLLTAGVPPATLLALLAAAIGVTLVLVGAWLHAVRGSAGGRWLISVGAVAAAAAALGSSAGPILLPGAARSVMAAVVAWSAPRWLRLPG